MKNTKSSSLANQFENKLSFIQELINMERVDDAFTEYSSLITEMEENIPILHNDLIASIYSSFAHFLFRVSEYESFYTMIIKAQEYGYSAEEIEAFFWAAFIEPNLPDFEHNYNANLQFLQSQNKLHFQSIPAFQELPYWLLPTGTENEFYIFNKQSKQIEERMTLFSYEQLQQLPTIDALSDYLIIANWNWSNILTCTQAIKDINKKSYVVVHEVGKFLACLQGTLLDHNTLSDVVIADQLSQFDHYVAEPSTILPRNIIDLTRNNEATSKYIQKWHDFRLHRENRDGSHVLLSICIPSYNRGQRAYETVSALLNSYYDEEIEIILSNNGTQNETKEFYSQIEALEDSRIKYFAFEENQGFAINCCKVCELATGKFVMLLSDEDLVDLSLLHLVMEQLQDSSDTLAILQTSVPPYSRWYDSIQNAGQHALFNLGLKSNYMSGLILNNNLLKENQAIDHVKNNLGNSVLFYYPHMYWELLLSQYGTVRSSSMTIINTGTVESTNFQTVNIQESTITMTYFASLEGRLKQHEGFSEIIQNLEITKHDSEFHRAMYLKLCAKTLAVVHVAIDAFYKKTNTNIEEVLHEAYLYISNFEFYSRYVTDNMDAYTEDSKHIYDCYNQHKEAIAI